MKYEYKTQNLKHVSGLLNCHHQAVLVSVTVVSLELVLNVCTVYVTAWQW
jgi:hypothetical protein